VQTIRTEAVSEADGLVVGINMNCPVEKVCYKMLNGVVVTDECGSYKTVHDPGNGCRIERCYWPRSLDESL